MKIKLSDILQKPYIKEITHDIPIKPVFEEIEIKEMLCPMSDGTALMCYGAFPVGKHEALPVILTRTPYGIGALRFFFEMAFYGYICVAQDCRGCGKSGGNWLPFENERSDGKDTLNWLEKQKWCKSIALTGSSYLSMNQYLVSDILTPKVKMLNIENFSPYRYELLYTGGMFHHEAYAGWTAYNTGIKNPPLSPDEMYEKFISHTPAIDADTAVTGQILPWYRQWLEGKEENSTVWNDGAYGLIPNLIEKINVPMLMHGGWYDPHIEGMVKTWRSLSDDVRSKSLFIVSPTNHKQGLCSDIKTQNEFECGGKRFIRSKLNFFEHYLKGKPFFQETPLGMAQLFVYGKNGYVTDSLKENSHKKSFYINCGKRSLDFFPTENNTEIKYTYDPSNPVPSCGSDVIMTDYMYHKNKKTTEGQRLVPPPNYRKDVVSFLSPVLEEDVDIAGEIDIFIVVSSSAEDTAFCAKLSAVYEDKSAYHIRESIGTMCIENGRKILYAPGVVKTLCLKTAPIFMHIKKGCRLRLDISSSDFPAYCIHPNTAQNWCSETHPVVAEQTIYGGKISF